MFSLMKYADSVKKVSDPDRYAGERLPAHINQNKIQ